MHKDAPRLSCFWQKHFFFLYQINNSSYNWFLGVIFFCSFYWSVVDLQCCAIVLQPLSHVQLFATPWNAAYQASLSFTISQSLRKLMPVELVMPSTHLILCHPLLLLSSVFPNIRVFSSESALRIGWQKYWSFNISPSNEYSGLISFRTDWFDLLAVQRTLKNPLQHHSSKASILHHSAFFMVQFSHPYMTTGKNHSFDYAELCQQSAVSAF